MNKDAVARLRAMSYEDYLLTEHWQNVRRRKLAEVHNQCESCAERGLYRCGNLEVHHLTYERLGEELMSDLRALCSVCHRSEHSIPITAKDVNRLRFVYGHETIALYEQIRN